MLDTPPKKILFVGSINPFFSGALAVKLRAKGHQVDSLSMYDLAKGSPERACFSRSFSLLPSRSRLGLLLFGWLRFVVVWLRVVLGRYDLLHIHYATNPLALALLAFVPGRNRFFISFYGSDIYRETEARKRFLAKRASKVWGVSCANEVTLAEVRELFSGNTGLSYYICRFGNSILNHLDVKSPHELFPNGRLRVAIGYNAASEQRHLEVLEAFSQWDGDKSQFEVLLQMTYGDSEGGAYTERVEDWLRRQGWKYKILKGYQSDDEIAKFRHESDIFVNVQPTDQFSNSLQENLYCKNICIVGSWLPYETFKKQGLQLIEIDHVVDIPQEVDKMRQQAGQVYSKMDCHPDVIRSFSGWEACLETWLNAYSEVWK